MCSTRLWRRWPQIQLCNAMAEEAIAADLGRDGYALLPWDAAVARWAEAALTVAAPQVRRAEMRRLWLRHGGTWFAGVDVLPNGPDGAIGGVPLAGPATEVIRHLGLWPETWHHAQVSVTYPGYPGVDPDEAPGAARYRRNRDAAHLDGLLPVGPHRRRMLREPHAFVLGLPLTKAAAEAAPLVVWPGSHRIMDAALSAILRTKAPGDWPDVDLTDAYIAARKTVFEGCDRRALVAQPGEAILLHRHMLHGIAPWEADVPGGPDGRMIAYFRPCLPDIADWLGP